MKLRYAMLIALISSSVVLSPASSASGQRLAARGSAAVVSETDSDVDADSGNTGSGNTDSGNTGSDADSGLSGFFKGLVGKLATAGSATLNAVNPVTDKNMFDGYKPTLNAIAPIVTTVAFSAAVAYVGVTYYQFLAADANLTFGFESFKAYVEQNKVACIAATAVGSVSALWMTVYGINNGRITYNSYSAKKLADKIADLQAQITALDGLTEEREAKDAKGNPGDADYTAGVKPVTAKEAKENKAKLASLEAVLAKLQPVVTGTAA